MLAAWIVAGVRCRAGSAGEIAVVKSKSLDAYEQALDGLRAQLVSSGVSAPLVEYDLTAARDTASASSARTAVVVALGALAAKAVYARSDGVPVLFSMVLDPVGSGLDPDRARGVCLDIPVRTQFRELLKVLPSVKRVGIVYTASENQTLIRQSADVAREMGLVLDSHPVVSAEQIDAVTRRSLKRFDVLWLLPDTTVCQPTVVKQLLRRSLRAGVPVMGISPSYVKAGALLAVSCDYEDIGRQTAELCAAAIAGEPPSAQCSLPPRKVVLSLNLAVAGRLRISIDGDVIAQAGTVVGP